MRILLSLFLVLVLAFPVFADRPLVTDDFTVLDFGKNALEMGYNPTRFHGSRHNSFSAYLKRGVMENVELGMEIPYYLTAPAGLGDAIIHAKMELFKLSEKEGLTSRIDIKLPNTNPGSGVGTSTSNFSLIMIYSKKWGEILTHWNVGGTGVGIAFGQGDQYSPGIFNFALAGEYSPWKDSRTLVVEWWGTQSTSSRVGCLQVGGKWEAKKDLTLDCSYTFGLTSDSPNMLELGFTAGF